MFTHKEMMHRICCTEFDLDNLVEKIESLEKRVKKLESKKERKVKNE